MARNPDFLQCKDERKQESFFKVLQSAGITSENMRALPFDLVRNFSDNDLSRKLKIRAQWGSSWEVGISKNPRFFFMEKSGWEKFVKDNALGNNEFLTFTHKGNMLFTVNIFKEDGKEMMQPPGLLASSSRVKTEQDVMKEEVMVLSELSSRGPKTAAESNGGGMFKRKLNTGKKKAEEFTNYKRTAKEVFSVRRNTAGASSSSSVAEFTIDISKSYIRFLVVPISFTKNMPRERTMFKIHHPDGKKSWSVAYLPSNYLIREYPLSVGTTCKFTTHQTKRAASGCPRALREEETMDVKVCLGEQATIVFWALLSFYVRMT